jgi:hypothetical protein
MHGYVIVEISGGMLCKVVGGSPEAPSCIQLSEAEAKLFRKSLQPPAIGADTIEATWVDWYNSAATPEQQETFDRITKQIDSAGLEGLPGGAQSSLIESYRSTNPAIYPALANYRDSGGRRALFAKYASNYGEKPISKVTEDGPIVEVESETEEPPRVVLRPGRYTYTDPVENNPSAGLFRAWLEEQIKARRAQALRTQVSEGVLQDLPIVSLISSPYYIDYEFLIATDVDWPTSVPGLPTWLPSNQDVQSYWGKPTGHAPPDIAALARLGQGAADLVQNILTVAVLLGVGYLLMAIGSRSSAQGARA